MQKLDYCIIGGGIAGTTAAETIRQYDGNGTIGIFCSENVPLYSRVMLSKEHYIIGTSPKERAYLRTDKQYAEQKIILFKGAEVVCVDIKNKEITLKLGKKIKYSKLLIATGGLPKKPDFIDKNYKNVLPVQTIDDASYIIDLLPNISKIVVAGSGFISFEMASIFAKAGKKVTVCIRKNRFWQKVLHSNASNIIEKALIDNGVIIKKDTEVKTLIGSDLANEVELTTGEKIPCELLVYGIGASYYQEWLAGSGIEQKNAIIVNKFLETSAKDVWAAGDCTEYVEPVTGLVAMPGNWANAQMQGKYAAEAMCDKKDKPFSYISSYTSGGCGIVPCFIGETRRDIADATILRGEKEEYPKFCELFIKDNKLIGAVLFNRGHEILPLRQLISKMFEVTNHEAQLQDTNFDLKQLTG